MGWPKGKPRKGHVNKDGTLHKPFGAGAYPNPVADPTGADDGPTLWGVVGSGPISEPCPKCGYAYADGGYCKECGWMKAVIITEYGVHVGRRF